MKQVFRILFLCLFLFGASTPPSWAMSADIVLSISISNERQAQLVFPDSLALAPLEVVWKTDDLQLSVATMGSIDIQAIQFDSTGIYKAAISDLLTYNLDTIGEVEFTIF